VWRTPSGPFQHSECTTALRAQGLHQTHLFAIVDSVHLGNSLKPAAANRSYPLYGGVVLCEEGLGQQRGPVARLLRALGQKITGINGSANNTVPRDIGEPSAPRSAQ